MSKAKIPQRHCSLTQITIYHTHVHPSTGASETHLNQVYVCEQLKPMMKPYVCRYAREYLNF